MTSAPDIDALVEKLRNPFVYENGEMDEDVVFADMLKAADALTALQADLKAAREALKPFADKSAEFDTAAKAFGTIVSDDTYKPRTEFTHGQLRAARRALTAHRGSE